MALLLGSTLTLAPIGEERLGRLLEESKGSVLVVNFWATWCGPCREEFPDLVRLFQEQKEKGLNLVSISMDEPEETEAAREFLLEQRVEFPSFIREFDDFEVFVNTIDSDWSGVLPTTIIFDREGNHVRRIEGQTDYRQLHEIVAPLLAEEK
jgi:thiol-disulfide isomerase/thioredoxin